MTQTRTQTRPAKYQHVANTLRHLRRAAGLTQEQLAHAVGLTLSGYRTYEQGKRNLKSEQIPTFAAALGVPISAITSRLWPEDPKLIETRYSLDWAEAQRQVADLPPDQQERVMRGIWQSIEIAKAADLARRN